MLYVVACRLIRRPSGTTLEAAELTVFLGGEFGVFFWGAYHQTEKPHVANPGATSAGKRDQAPTEVGA